MTNKQRQLLLAARDRAAHAREMWEQEQAWQPLLRQELLTESRTPHRYMARRSNYSVGHAPEPRTIVRH
jgi:hypothetical protein